MKHLHLVIFTAASALLMGVGLAQQNPSNRLNRTDESFVTKAAHGGVAEVELGRLATEHNSNQKVKDFGRRMVEDHSKANEELKTIASKKGVTLPSNMDSKSATTKNRLSNLNGAEFDRAYMRDMVADHKEDVAEFQREADSGTDPDLKAFAARTLPTLKEHLQMAEDTLNAVK
jgi:putative membrane protein